MKTNGGKYKTKQNSENNAEKIRICNLNAVLYMK